MRKAKRSNRLTALALSVLMVLTMTPVTASAQGVRNDGTAGEIIAFEALPQKTQQQTVSLGTALEDLDLPGSLNATMRIEAAADTEEPEQEGAAPPVLDSGGPAQGNEIPGDMDGDIFADGEQEIGTPSDVQEPQQQSSDQPVYLEMNLPVPAEWASSPAYDGDTAGVYTFTAEIEGFTLSAELPQIAVTVGTPAGVITAFDALADEIRWQSVEYGTAWEDLNLPKTLSATVEGEAAEVPVKWQADPAYDASTKGLYLLTAQLAEGFSATAELPHIAVVVRAEQPRFLLRSFGGGAKSTDPFLIGTAAQLAEIATLTNEGRLETMFLGTSGGTVYLKLDNDIDLSGYTEDGGWVPIGWYDTTTNTDYAFKGSFDGDGHVITGLYINRSDSNYQGLFGGISIGGTVQNLGVVEVNITGKISVGGVAGAVSGTVQSCYSTGSVSGGNSVGGVAGNVSGTVQSCYSTGSVEGIDYVGGVVGRLVTRGGEPYPTVSNCYATGSVTGSGKNVGGVVGDALGGNSSAKVSVKNCAALNPSVSGEQSVGRVVGYGNDSAIFERNIAFSGMTVTVNGSAQTPVAGADKVDGESKTAANIKAENFFQTLFGGDNNAWAYGTGKLPGFGAAIEMPAHIVDITSGYFNGKGTVESPYEISTPQQLAKLAELVNYAYPEYNSQHYILMNDLDLSAYGKDYNDGKGWVPIGKNYSQYPFRGNFDGNYKTITGLYINRADIYQGLFGVVSGTVKNLGVNEADITGGNICGGITGRISGTVENCFVTGKIHGSSSDIGGIAGVTIGTVKNCYSSAEISSSSSARVGGIAGQVITGAKIENCYSTGSVSGKEKVGGIAGVTNGTVQNCAALNPSVAGTGTGTDAVGRVVGSGSAALENNIAFSGMTVTVNNTPQTITDGAADDKK